MTDTTTELAGTGQRAQSSLHFKADARKLAAVLESVERGTEKKTTIPILGCVLLTAAAGRLAVRGTDLVVDMSCDVPDVQILSEGSVSLRVAPLLEIVRTIPGEVEVQEQPNLKTQIRARGVRTRLEGLAANCFPPARPATSPVVTVAQSVLKSLISRCDFAASQREDNRFSLCCLKFNIGDGAIEVVGTDGHRLSHAIAACEKPEAPMSFLVSLRAVPIVANLGTDEDQVGIAEGGESIFFSLAKTVVEVRKVSGGFPDWRKIFPDSFECKAKLLAGELAATLRRINVVADRDHSFLAVFSPRGIQFRAASSAVGDIVEDVEAAVEGSRVVSAYNSDYLLEFLTKAVGDVTLNVTSEKGPLVLTLEGWRHVLMPMVVKDSLRPKEAEVQASAPEVEATESAATATFT